MKTKRKNLKKLLISLFSTISLMLAMAKVLIAELETIKTIIKRLWSW